MAWKYLGNDPINRSASVTGGVTYFDATNPATIRGIVKRFEIYCVAGGGTVKAKVFRDDGTNYVFVGESQAYTTVIGLNTLACWIPIEVGDFIGFYVVGHQVDDTDGGGSQRSYPGDVITTMLKTSWASAAKILSIRGTIYTRAAPL